MRPWLSAPGFSETLQFIDHFAHVVEVQERRLDDLEWRKIAIRITLRAGGIF